MYKYYYISSKYLHIYKTYNLSYNIYITTLCLTAKINYFHPDVKYIK